MTTPLEGRRGSVSGQNLAEPIPAPAEKAEGLAKEELRSRLSVDSPPGGPRNQPVESRRQDQLSRIVQNSPMGKDSFVSGSVPRSSVVSQPPSRNPPPRPNGPSSPQAAQLHTPPGRQPPPRPSGPSSQAAPVLQQTAPIVQAGQRAPSARVMTDREVLTALLETGKHADLQTPDAVEKLTTKLEAHTPNFATMSSKDMVKLSMALRNFGGSRLDEFRGRVDTALAGRMENMALNPAVTQPGATRAGVRAAFVDRFSSLKEDVDTLSLLARDSSSLPADDRRTAALTKALWGTMGKLAGVMVHGADEKSPGLIAKAVELAKLAHATFLELNPLESPDLEAFLTTALVTQGESLREAELVVMGQTGETKSVDGKKVGIAESNAVSDAVGLQVDDADTPSNREAKNVQLFRRALGYAIKPKWAEPSSQGDTTTLMLFGDGTRWPTDAAKTLKGEFKDKHWDRKTVATCEELLALFEGLRDLSRSERMTQKEAERLIAPLQALMRKHDVTEPLGNDNIRFKWNLAPLATLDPRARAVQLREMLNPARIALERRIVTDVNQGRRTANIARQSEADQKARMSRNILARQLEKEREAAKAGKGAPKTDFEGI